MMVKFSGMEIEMSTSGYSIDDGATFLVIPRGGNEDDPFEVTAEMGLVIMHGNPDDACVIEGSRAGLLDALDAAVKGIEAYYVAEHENGYHLRAPEERCRKCSPDEWACPNCGEAGHCRWTHRGANGEQLAGDWVKCYEEGSITEFPKGCGHVWQPFQRQS